ncbi:MAG: SDR family oxidoreductase [Gemmatimonadaceae bacterium]|nr:SDR family oxidoreductase [Gemmatimonadaceae bacterium]
MTAPDASPASRSRAPRPVCLITGASSGIGADLAHCAAADGFDLVLVARRITALADVARVCEKKHDVKVTIIQSDLADPTACRVLAAELRARQLPVHTLINNAGFGASGSIASIAVETQLNMIQVNITALTELTRRLLPGMLERGSGAVMNVASTAAFLPGPGMAVYYASKAYVLSFTEALAEELRGTGIGVTALCPGPTATEFGAVAGMSESKLFKQRGIQLTSAEVARAGWDALLAGERIVIPGFANKVLIQSLRTAPRMIVARISALLNASS